MLKDIKNKVDDFMIEHQDATMVIITCMMLALIVLVIVTLPDTIDSYKKRHAKENSVIIHTVAGQNIMILPRCPNIGVPTEPRDIIIIK